jgi:hypothetical protein
MLTIVTGCRRIGIAIAFFSMAVATFGQLPERPHTDKPPAEPPPSGVVSPELETFGRIIAIQASPEQVSYFNSAIASTDLALQESRELQRLGTAATNIGLVNGMSLRLRDSLDDVEHYNGRLLASFTKLQETELKKLIKPLRKSYSQVSRDTRAVQQLMEPGKVVPDQLATGAANLEKALSDFRTDQIRLGREMGIQSK